MLTIQKASLSKDTKEAYHRYVASYVTFSRETFSTSSVFSASTGGVATSNACLFSKNYAPASLLTNMSALSYIHKLSGQPDPTKYFVIKKLFNEAYKMACIPDTR